MFFDSRVDFRFNAGPLEKLQSALGPLGDLMGAVTDQLMKYHVTGTLSEPEFSVKPLGLGIGNADNTGSVTFPRSGEPGCGVRPVSASSPHYVQE